MGAYNMYSGYISILQAVPAHYTRFACGWSCMDVATCSLSLPILYTVSYILCQYWQPCLNFVVYNNRMLPYWAPVLLTQYAALHVYCMLVVCILDWLTKLVPIPLPAGSIQESKLPVSIPDGTNGIICEALQGVFMYTESYRSSNKWSYHMHGLLVESAGL